MGCRISSNEPIESTDGLVTCVLGVSPRWRAVMISITLRGGSRLLFRKVSRSSCLRCSWACLMVSARSPRTGLSAVVLGVVSVRFGLVIVAGSVGVERVKNDDQRETGRAGRPVAGEISEALADT